jgi:hypothetical protein
MSNPRGRPNPELSDPANPKNFYGFVGAWRRRRAAKGRGDNWLTRPLIRYRGGKLDILPPTKKRD